MPIRSSNRYNQCLSATNDFLFKGHCSGLVGWWDVILEWLARTCGCSGVEEFTQRVSLSVCTHVTREKTLSTGTGTTLHTVVVRVCVCYTGAY